MEERADNRAIRVVVVDDHPCYAHGLKALLSTRDWGLDVVGVATTAKQAAPLIEQCSSDVIALNPRMPGLDGLKTIEQIRARHPAVRVLIVASSCDPHSVCSAIQAGASGYVLKTAEIEELVHILGVVASGGTAYSSGIELNGAGLDDVEELTEDENMLLKLVALGLTNDEIAHELNSSLAVLKRHMAALFRKIDVSNRVQAAVFASRRGAV